MSASTTPKPVVLIDTSTRTARVPPLIDRAQPVYHEVVHESGCCEQYDSYRRGSGGKPGADSPGVCSTIRTP